MADLAQADPGRWWRRLASAGAVLTVLAMFIPINDPWNNLSTIMIGTWRRLPPLGYSLQLPSDLNMGPGIFEGVPAILSTIPFVAGLVIWILCERSTRVSMTMACSLVTGLVVTAGTGYIAFLYSCPVVELLWIPTAYIFLAALALLDGWHRRGTILCAFWPGTFVSMSACIAWGLMAIITASVQTTYGWGATRSNWMSFFVGGTSSLGSVMSALGWFLWWHAVRKAEALAASNAEAPTGASQT